MEPLHIAVPPRAICSGSDLETRNGSRHAAGNLSYSTAETPPATPLPNVLHAWAGGFASLPYGSFAKINDFLFVTRRAFTLRSERDAIVMQALWVRQSRDDEWTLMAETRTRLVIVVSRMLYCAGVQLYRL